MCTTSDFELRLNQQSTHVIHAMNYMKLHVSVLYFDWHDLLFPFIAAVMGEYEPKIEVQFPDTLHVSKGSSVKLECFALGK